MDGVAAGVGGEEGGEPSVWASGASGEPLASQFIVHEECFKDIEGKHGGKRTCVFGTCCFCVFYLFLYFFVSVSVFASHILLPRAAAYSPGSEHLSYHMSIRI